MGGVKCGFGRGEVDGVACCETTLVVGVGVYNGTGHEPCNDKAKASIYIPPPSTAVRDSEQAYLQYITLHFHVSDLAYGR